MLNHLLKYIKKTTPNKNVIIKSANYNRVANILREIYFYSFYSAIL